MFRLFGQSRSNHTQESAILASNHTPSNPYCDDPKCSCHTNLGWHDQVTGMQQYSEEEVSEALKFWDICNS